MTKTRKADIIDTEGRCYYKSGWPSLVNQIKLTVWDSAPAVNSLLWSVMPARSPGIPEHEVRNVQCPSTSAYHLPPICICVGVRTVGQPLFVTALLQSPPAEGRFYYIEGCPVLSIPFCKTGKEKDASWHQEASAFLTKHHTARVTLPERRQ